MLMLPMRDEQRQVNIELLICEPLSLAIYPEKTLLYHFHAEKALFKGTNFATEILGLKVTIVPLTPKKEKFPQFTRPDGLIDKNPCRNATQLL